LARLPTRNSDGDLMLLGRGKDSGEACRRRSYGDAVWRAQVAPLSNLRATGLPLSAGHVGSACPGFGFVKPGSFGPPCLHQGPGFPARPIARMSPTLILENGGELRVQSLFDHHEPSRDHVSGGHYRNLRRAQMKPAKACFTSTRLRACAKNSQGARMHPYGHCRKMAYLAASPAPGRFLKQNLVGSPDTNLHR
jgi:hypothetical protein